MTSPSSGTAKATRATIRELLRGRTQVVERLADQFDKWEQAKAAVAAAQSKADEEAATARAVYQEALEAGWTAAELNGAGLKPPAPPRKRGATTDSDAPVAQ
jgi:hypothetical protein